MAAGDPVILSVVGDSFVEPCQIIAIIWEGATSSGHTATVSNNATGNTIWKGRTDLSQTYQGISFSPNGLPMPGGFSLSQISAGKVYVYLKEA